MIAVNSTIIDVLHPTVNSFIGGVKVSMLALSVVGCGFGPWSNQTKDKTMK
jgi:hypothetical protein